MQNNVINDLSLILQVLSLQILFQDFNDFIDFSLIEKCSEEIINTINSNLEE